MIPKIDRDALAAYAAAVADTPAAKVALQILPGGAVKPQGDIPADALALAQQIRPKN